MQQQAYQCGNRLTNAATGLPMQQRTTRIMTEKTTSRFIIFSSLDCLYRGPESFNITWRYINIYTVKGKQTILRFPSFSLNSCCFHEAYFGFMSSVNDDALDVVRVSNYASAKYDVVFCQGVSMFPTPSWRDQTSYWK